MSEATPRYVLPEVPANFDGGLWEYFFAEPVFQSDVAPLLTDAGSKGWQIEVFEFVGPQSWHHQAVYRIVFKRPLVAPKAAATGRVRSV